MWNHNAQCRLRWIYKAPKQMFSIAASNRLLSQEAGSEALHVVVHDFDRSAGEEACENERGLSTQR